MNPNPSSWSFDIAPKENLMSLALSKMDSDTIFASQVMLMFRRAIFFLSLVASVSFAEESRSIKFDSEIAKQPKIEELAAEMRRVRASAGLLDNRLRIGLVGVCPDVSDQRLQSQTDFSIRRFDECSDSCSKDTKLCVWLRETWPEISIVTADIPEVTDCDGIEREFIRRIQWLLKQELDSLIIREPFLSAANKNESVFEAFSECWKARCLPILVTKSTKTANVPGVLHVQVVESLKKEISSAGRIKHGSAPAGLPASLLIGKHGLDVERAAIAYTAIASSAQPVARSPLAHLERASRLWQSSPAFVVEEDGIVRLLNAVGDKSKGFFLACSTTKLAWGLRLF